MHKKEYQEQDWIISKIKVPSVDKNTSTDGPLYLYGVEADARAYL